MSAAAAYTFESGSPGTVVLVVPVSDFPGTGARTESYLAAVHQLLDAADS